MSPTLQSIARENFRKSGYITHPMSEPPSRWSFVKPPSCPFSSTDILNTALQRRVQAYERRTKEKTSRLKTYLDVIFRR